MPADKDKGAASEDDRMDAAEGEHPDGPPSAASAASSASTAPLDPTPSTSGTSSNGGQQQRIDTLFSRMQQQEGGAQRTRQQPQHKEGSTTSEDVLDISPPDNVQAWKGTETETDAASTTTGQSTAGEEGSAAGGDDDDEVTVVEAPFRTPKRAATSPTKGEPSKKKQRTRRSEEIPLGIPQELEDLLAEASRRRGRPLLFNERRLVTMRRYCPTQFIEQLRDDLKTFLDGFRTEAHPRLPPTLMFAGRAAATPGRPTRPASSAFATPKKTSPVSGANATRLGKKETKNRLDVFPGSSKRRLGDEDWRQSPRSAKKPRAGAARTAPGPSDPFPGSSKTITGDDGGKREGKKEEKKPKKTSQGPDKPAPPTHDDKRRAELIVHAGNLCATVWGHLEARLERDIDKYNINITDTTKVGSRVFFEVDNDSFRRLRRLLLVIVISGRRFDLKWERSEDEEQGVRYYDIKVLWPSNMRGEAATLVQSMRQRNGIGGAIILSSLPVTVLADGARVATLRVDRTAARELTRLWETLAARGEGDDDGMKMKCRLGRCDVRFSYDKLHDFASSSASF